MPISQEELKSVNNRIYLKVDLLDWVCKTVKRVKKIEEWNKVWVNVYTEIGGLKEDTSGSKGCPRSAAKTLWYLGMLKCSERPLLNWSYDQINKNLSKNGVYAVLTVDILKINPNLSDKRVWLEVERLFKKILPEEDFPHEDEGASIVAYKLDKLGQIRM